MPVITTEQGGSELLPLLTNPGEVGQSEKGKGSPGGN